MVRVAEEEEGEEEGEGLPRYDAQERGLPTYNHLVLTTVGDAPRYVEAVAGPVQVEGRRTGERREQFWWGVEGGAGGVA